MKNTIPIFCFILFATFSQVVSAQEWSFGGELGATLLSFFQYTPKESELFDRGYQVPHNEGWILTYYPLKKKIFLSLAYTRFHPNAVSIRVRDEEGFSGRQISTGPFDHTIALNVGHQIDIGSPVRLKAERLFFEPLYGIGIQILQAGHPYPHVGVINLDGYDYDRGINPSLQAGFRLSYRYRRSKFSLKALGNLGLRYHSETQYTVTKFGRAEQVTFRSKSDFLAAQVSYEYIFKSSKVEGRKNKKVSVKDSMSSFERIPIQELKTGIHYFGWNKYFTLNYEYFPTYQKQSWALDVTYFQERKWRTDDRWLSEPFLDIRIGRQLFSNAENASDWGVGYYLRSAFKLAKNRQYAAAFEEEYNMPLERKHAFYFAAGASLQYKWLIKDRWSIMPMLSCDLGVASGDARSYKYPVFLRPLYFDLQGRLYVGYRL